MNKDKLRVLREAIEENLDPETLLDILDLQIYELLDMVDDEMLVDFYDELTDAIPTLNLEPLDEEH